MTAGKLQAAISAAHAKLPPTVAKASPTEPPDTLEKLREAAKAALVGTDTTDVEQVLRQMWFESYVAGTHAAMTQTGGTMPGQLGQLVDSTDWSTWQPGDLDAAVLTDSGGLADLMDSAGVTIQGIQDSTVDLIGNRIADGLLSGDSMDAVASSLSDYLSDPAQAQRVAITETNRAVSTASINGYAANGIDQWDLVLSDGACDECVDAQSAGPYSTSETGILPVHPFCRCSGSPRVTAGLDHDDAAPAELDEGPGPEA